MFEQEQVLVAFSLTIIAGLSTGIGSLIALFAKHTNREFLSASLGFSAGVMLYISFMEMLPNAKKELLAGANSDYASLLLLLAFFGGIAFIALIDFFVPKDINPHEVRGVEDLSHKSSLHRMGIFVAISISIHNFPEGIATFMSGLSGLDIAIPIALAVAIHNIPEGIAVSVPIYHATGSKRKAFWYSFLSGLAEPLGALIAYFFLSPFWSQTVSGVVLAAVSGIMVFISLDELLPAAQKYGKHHVAVFSLVAGMFLMGISLYLYEVFNL